MSYDVSIGPESFNYTSNVAALFYDHMPAVNSRGGLHELDGLTGRQALPVLQAAFEQIGKTKLRLWRQESVGEPEFCARYDAKNGWGSTVGAVLFLAQIMAACGVHPRCKVRVWS